MSKSGSHNKKTEKKENAGAEAAESTDSAGVAVGTIEPQENSGEPVADGTPADVPAKVEPPQLSPAEIEELKAKAAKAEENWQRFVRNYADFENYKKRAMRERDDAARYSTEAVVKRLIPILDSFDMAMATPVQSDDPAVKSLTAGMTMVHQQLKSALVESGLEEIDATGKAFDPNVHEAVSEQDSTEVPEGHVLMQMRKGYKIRDRLLRPATVVVARKPSE